MIYYFLTFEEMIAAGRKSRRYHRRMVLEEVEIVAFVVGPRVAVFVVQRFPIVFEFPIDVGD